MERITVRSVRFGIAAGLGMFGFYVVVVRFASGSAEHLSEQLRADWYLVAVVALAFAVQAALFVELRHRHRLQAASAAASGGAMGASTLGMVACCAHHLAELAPFLGLAGAATFLYDYRLLFVVMGLGTNVVAITFLGGALRRMPSSTSDESRDKDPACEAV